MARHVVIGVGNRDRGDDAVGPFVCDRLHELAVEGVEPVVAELGGVDLATCWRSDDAVTIVDASRPVDRPGRIVEVDALRERWTPPAAISTHATDVATAIELARVIGAMPASLTVIGIEGGRFDVGAPLSTQVEAAAHAVVDGITRRARAGAR